MSPVFPRSVAAAEPTAPVRRAPAGVLGLLLMTTFAAPANAQTLKPWVPPAVDSLVRWAAEAKVRFQGQAGDSIGGSNYPAYELVGRMGRRMLRSLGKDGMAQAPAIRPVLDSLGLDTEVLVDPELPHFALLMVRNPYRRTASAVGFLYWYRGDDLRMQGALFRGGFEPSMRAWWTGAPEAPYSWGVVDRSRDDDQWLRFTLFRLAPNGVHWNLVQHDDTGIRLGSRGSIAWADMNGDQRPELVVYVPAEKDTVFDECADCPRLVNELAFMERPEGFRLLDTRLVPTPYATFQRFVRLLLENSREPAARLLAQPSMLPRALAAGWGVRRHRGTWVVEQAEPGAAWPQWLLVRFRGPQGDKRYRVNFEVSRGRWVIRDWAEREAAPAGSVRSAPPRTARPPARPDSTRKGG